MSLIYISLSDVSVRKTINVSDANNLTEPGYYYANGTYLNNIPNIPDTTKYSIRVLPMNDSGSCSQELVDYLGNVYLRICNNGSWANWGKVNGSGSGSSTFADYAERLHYPRAISISGDATGSANFDGSVNISIPVDISASGVIAAGYGPTANKTGTDDNTIVIPRILVAEDGRITYAKDFTLTTKDSNVKQVESTTTAEIPILLAYAANPTSNSINTVQYSKNVKIIPNSGTIIAKNIIVESISSSATKDTSLAVGDSATSTAANYSLAVGQSATTSGIASLAVGNHVSATGYNQVAIGKYNVADNSGDIALIIGNGTSESARHNLIEAKYDGTLTVTGKALDSHNGSLTHYMKYKASKDDVDYTVPGLYFGTISPDGSTITEDTSIKSTGIKTTTITGTETSYFGDISFKDTISYPQIAGDGTRLVLSNDHTTASNLVIENNIVRPSTNDSQTLGTASFRWSAIYSSTGTIVTSDEESKTDIKNIKEDIAVDFINKITPIMYKLNDGNSGRIHWGFGARQIESTLKEIGLSTAEFGGIIKAPKEVSDDITLDLSVEKDSYEYALRYDEFNAPLVKAVQASYNKINKLEKELKVMQNTVNTLTEILLIEKGGE